MTYLRLIACLFLAFLLQGQGCQQQAQPVEAAVKSELVNGNGFYLTLVYQTSSPLIIAHVEEVQELRNSQGAVIRTFKLDYWEWFTLAPLPNQGGIPAAEWQNIRQFQGKPVVLSDALATGPGLVEPNMQVRGSKVIITRTHTLYTGGAVVNQGNGSPMDLGNFGFLDKDANGTQPSAIYSQGGQTLDKTQDWRSNKTIQGEIQNVGTEKLKLVLKHEGVWDRAAGQPNWSIDWTFSKTIGTAAPATSQGTDTQAQTAKRP